ncbi:MAG: dihydrofolate reductase family protein, partial [Leptospirales bacterium]|nr:dihydrofolate reductase family protein [Leptospirales bacterium]
DPAKWQSYYGSIPCWVFSHKTLPAIPGAALHFVSGDVASAHASMVEAAKGKNIWIAGGGELVGQFADAGLLDELILAYAPVMLGDGAPLLPRRITSERLKLVSAEKRGPFLHATYTIGPGKP